MQHVTYTILKEERESESERERERSGESEGGRERDQLAGSSKLFRHFLAGNCFLALLDKVTILQPPAHL
jgi:hypothetical protein